MPKTVLLVDDSRVIRQIGTLTLKGEGFQVIEAVDGRDALEKIRGVNLDLIITDINMPEMTGLEAVKQIKQEMPHVRIIMLTVSGNDRDLFTAIKNGADGYLLKNLEPSELFDMLDCVRRGEAPV